MANKNKHTILSHIGVFLAGIVLTLVIVNAGTGQYYQGNLNPVATFQQKATPQISSILDKTFSDPVRIRLLTPLPPETYGSHKSVQFKGDGMGVVGAIHLMSTNLVNNEPVATIEISDKTRDDFPMNVAEGDSFALTATDDSARYYIKVLYVNDFGTLDISIVEKKI
jgi:hypothetical protein